MANKFGYLVLAEEPLDISVQRDALIKAGCKEADIYNDIAFKEGSQTKPYSKLRQCMARMSSGDSLVIYRLNRFGRSFLWLSQIFADLRGRGVKIVVLDPPLNFDDTPAGAARFEMLAQYVSFLETVLDDRKYGRRNRVKGRIFVRKGGREPSLNPAKIAEIVAKRMTENRTITSLATEYDVARNTIYKALRKN